MTQRARAKDTRSWCLSRVPRPTSIHWTRPPKAHFRIRRRRLRRSFPAAAGPPPFVSLMFRWRGRRKGLIEIQVCPSVRFLVLEV